MEYQAKLNEKYMPVLFCISSFGSTSYKKLHGIARFWVGFKEKVRSLGKELRDYQSGEKPLGWITVHFSSNKIQSRSALQIALLKM